MIQTDSATTAAMKRAASRQWVLKPQDLAVALKLVVLRGRWLSYAALGEAMHLSRYEAHAAVQRLLAARLLDVVEGSPRPVMDVLRSFVVYGAPHAYPPVRGELTIGFPTAQAVPPLKGKVAVDELPPVWPHPEGIARGQGLLPLYEKLPLAARDDPALYELLALLDALRIGQGRERELARQLLEQRLSAENDRKGAETMDDDVVQIGRQLTVSRKDLEALAKKYHIRRLSLFGSAARGELRPDSDIDLLVEFEPDKAPSLWKTADLQDEFSRLFQGRPVDVASPEILRNPFRRRTIEKDLKVLFDEAA